MGGQVAALPSGEYLSFSALNPDCVYHYQQVPYPAQSGFFTLTAGAILLCLAYCVDQICAIAGSHASQVHEYKTANRTLLKQIH